MKWIFALLAVAALLLSGCAGAAQQAPETGTAEKDAGQPEKEKSQETTAPPPPPEVPPAENNSSQVPQLQMNNSSNSTPPFPPVVNNSSQISPPAENNSSQITPQPPEQQVNEFTVEVYQFGFNPSRIDVNKGDRVRIILKSLDTSHGFSIPQFGIDIKAPAGGTATGEFVADQEGSFIFRCSVFCGDGHGTRGGGVVVRG